MESWSQDEGYPHAWFTYVLLEMLVCEQPLFLPHAIHMESHQPWLNILTVWTFFSGKNLVTLSSVFYVSKYIHEKDDKSFKITDRTVCWDARRRKEKYRKITVETSLQKFKSDIIITKLNNGTSTPQWFTHTLMMLGWNFPFEPSCKGHQSWFLKSKLFVSGIAVRRKTHCWLYFQKM